MEPRVAMPMPPHAVQSITMPRVAGRVVRKLEVILQSRSLAAAVVGLAGVAEAARDGTERDRCTERHVADGVQQIEEAIALDVEDQIEFLLIFIWQEVTSLNSGGMQQHIDAAAALAHLVDHFGDGLSVREVDAEIMCRATCGAYRVDGGLRGVRSLQPGEFLFDERRSGALAAGLNACEQIAFQIFFVGYESFEIRIVRIGLAAPDRADRTCRRMQPPNQP